MTTCAKCGACTAVCPIYQATGRESLTARGRIHLLERLSLSGPSKNFINIFSQCLLCNACFKACPRGIGAPEMVIKAREELPGLDPALSIKKLIARSTLASPSLLTCAAIGTRAAQVLAKGLPAESGLRLKLGLLKDAKRGAGRGFVRELSRSNTVGKNKVAYFAGCLANYLYRDIGEATVRLHETLCKQQVVAPQKQTCCGMAAFGAGSRPEAVELAKANIRAFEEPDIQGLPIITSCATCYSHLRTYPSFFEEGSEWQARAAAFASRVQETANSLLAGVKDKEPELVSLGPRTLLYHDPCHLRFPNPWEEDTGRAIIAEPRELLSLLPEVNLVELASGPQCCGMGGLFTLAHPDLSQRINDPLIDAIEQSGAQTVVTSCSGCFLQIQEGVQRHGLEIRVEHLTILLAEYIA